MISAARQTVGSALFALVYEIMTERRCRSTLSKMEAAQVPFPCSGDFCFFSILRAKHKRESWDCRFLFSSTSGAVGDLVVLSFFENFLVKIFVRIDKNQLIRIEIWDFARLKFSPSSFFLLRNIIIPVSTSFAFLLTAKVVRFYLYFGFGPIAQQANNDNKRK